MNCNFFIELIMASLIASTTIQTISFAAGQDGEKSPSAKTNSTLSYAATARHLLNQTQIEYSKGNTTGAEDLATRAYLDNFEYVEALLEQKGKNDLKESIEKMMRVDVRTMIKDKVPSSQLSELINETDSKLAEVISILNDTNRTLSP